MSVHAWAWLGVCLAGELIAYAGYAFTGAIEDVDDDEGADVRGVEERGEVLVALVELYRDTADRRYLDLAGKLTGIGIARTSGSCSSIGPTRRRSTGLPAG